MLVDFGAIKFYATKIAIPIKVINPMSDSGVSISSVRVLELEEKPKSERKFSTIRTCKNLHTEITWKVTFHELLVVIELK